MKTKIANSRRPDILGNGDRSSDQEIFTTILKQWRPKLGYCSIFAAVPAMLVSQVQGTLADEAKKPKVSIAGRTTRLLERLNKNRSNPALLKRQSKFLLPHQEGNFAMLATLAGNDDCPGRAIPGGNYTAAAPYSESGDTTGANDTITSLFSYYYSSYDAHGPDHVYSFTLTGRGPNPQIEVSTTSGTYRPLVYVLQGGSAGTCPAGTGNFASNDLVLSDSRWTTGSTATLNNSQMNYLPLNVPLYLFVDSAFNDAGGSGPYTIRMQDVTIVPAANPNPIDSADFFVRQQYLDFLNREPDAAGLQFYLNVLNGCAPTDTECLKYTRGALSANFFRSPEFQQKGSFVMYLYMISIGQRPATVAEVQTTNQYKMDRPHYSEFFADLQSISDPNDDKAAVSARKDALTVAWLQRSEVQQNLPSSLTNQQFVQKLETIAGVTLSNETTLIASLNNGNQTRASVLRAVAESPEVDNKFYKQSFVTMEYFGYLRRDPEGCIGSSDPANCGYIFHNSRFQLAADPDFLENTIVRGFIESAEYRQRFGP